MSSLMAQELKYGLNFNSYEVEQEKRTGLNLTPAEEFSFPEGFSLSFDVCFKSEAQSFFGFVFRIIGQNEQHIDFLLSETKGTTDPNLTITYSFNGAFNWFFSDLNFKLDEYFHFEATIDIKNNTLNILIGDRKESAEVASLEDFKKTNIIFGKCDYPYLQIWDVPVMSVKNIRINDHKQVPVYFWPLSKHTQNGVYDELKHRFAGCENPQWELDKHALWKKQVAFNTQNNPQICYDYEENRIAIADRRYFHSYHTHSKTLRKDKLTDGFPHSIFANQIIHNSWNHTYYSYHFLYEQGVKVAGYDTLTGQWENKFLEASGPYFWHHNRIISPFDSCLYTFGGYGYHKYRNIINKYDFKTQIWENLHYRGDEIKPRYLSGLGMIDDSRILIFGGYGSETGNQELSPQNYYDLYMIDTRTMTAKKIWELPPPINNFVVANSIVIDTVAKCFYALCFPQQLYSTSLFLAKFSMEKPVYEIIADSIPFTFQDIYSYADLYLNKDIGELTAITSSPLVKDSSAIVSIYSLSFPPLAETDLYQKEEDNRFCLWTIGNFLLFVLFCAGCYAIFYQRWKKKKIVKTDSSSTTSEQKYESLFGIKPVYKRIDKRAIYLFGGFQVTDKDAMDITGYFTPLLKQLFLIILLNTLKDGKGISSLKLRETFWFDKNDGSAKNNRGVSLSKLRQIFELIGFIRINNQNSYWIIEFGDDIYCDYYEALVLMKRLKEKANRTGKDIKRLLSIVSVGELLPDLQIEWMDAFKADFSNELINLFLNIAQQPDLEISDQERIDLATVIMTHDSLNEDALKLKCSILAKMGKNGLAKKTYNAFVKEYSTLLATTFKYSFDQINS